MRTYSIKPRSLDKGQVYGSYPYMKIVVLDGHTLNPGDNPWQPITDVLKETDEFIVYGKTEAFETVDRAQGAEIVLTNKTVLQKQHLEALPQLRLICVLATGVNTVDIQAASDLGILVCNVPEYGTDSVAQFVMAQILHFAHRTTLHDQRIRDGAWRDINQFCFWDTPQLELVGRTCGIIGYGRIGRAVGKLATAFGMNVIAYSTSGPKPDGIARPVSLDAIFSESDIITLHCSLNEATQGLINAQSLSGMKRSAYLINTARGGLIVEEDLEAALQSGAIAGAALDVLSEEPISDGNPLLKAPNLLLTPHMAWGSVEARKRLMKTTAGNIKAFLTGGSENTVS